MSECDALLDHARELLADAVAERDSLRTELDAAREALRFYSDGFAYLTPEGWRTIWRDAGAVARAALTPRAEGTE